MIRNDVIDGTAGRTLPSFGQPHSGDHDTIIGAPDACNEVRFAGYGHMAIAGSTNECECCLKKRWILPLTVIPDRSQQAETTGVCIDDTDSNGAVGSQAQFLRASGGEMTEECAHGAHILHDLIGIEGV